jgi:hypothetical protein
MNSRGLRRRNGAAPPVRRHNQIIAQVVEQKVGRTLSADEAHKRFVEALFSPGSTEEHEGGSRPSFLPVPSKRMKAWAEAQSNKQGHSRCHWLIRYVFFSSNFAFFSEFSCKIHNVFYSIP